MRDAILQHYEPAMAGEGNAETRREALREFFNRCPIATKSEAVAWLTIYWPDISRGGHRGNIQRWFPDGAAPWESVEKECPNCDTFARGAEEIDEKFGVRKMGKYIRPQSYCRDCR